MESLKCLPHCSILAGLEVGTPESPEWAAAEISAQHCPSCSHLFGLESVEFLSGLQPKTWGDFTFTFWGDLSVIAAFRDFLSWFPTTLSSACPVLWTWWAIKAQLHRHGSLLSRAACPTGFTAGKDETIASHLSRSYWTFLTHCLCALRVSQLPRLPLRVLWEFMD